MFNFFCSNPPQHIAICSGLFHSFRLFTGPINAIFLLNRGVTFQQLVGLQILFAASSLIIGGPVGFCADRLSHKKSVILGFCCTASYYLFYLAAPELLYLCVAQIILSIGLSLIDVNFTAWLAKETLHHSSRHLPHLDHYTYLENEIQSTGGILSSILFVFFSLTLAHEKFFYEKIYGMTTLSVLCLIYYVRKIPERKIPLQTPTTSLNFSEIAHTYLAAFKNSNTLLFITISSLCWCAYQPLFHFWQPLLISKNFFSLTVHTMLGLSFVSLHLIVFLFSKSMKSLSHHSPNYYLLGASFSLINTGLFYLLGPYLSNAVAAIFVFSVLHGCMAVLWKIPRNQYLKNSPQETYGRILSLSGMSCRLCSLFFLISISFFSSCYSLPEIFSLCCYIHLVNEEVLTLRQFLKKEEV